MRCQSNVLSYIVKLRNFLFLFVLVFCISNNAFAGRVMSDGSVPPWITGTTNTLVNNMRSLVGKMPTKVPYNPDLGTTCVYSLSVSLRGTHYGADAKYGLDVSKAYPNDMLNTDQLRARAQEKGEWHFADNKDYTPRAGDACVVVGKDYDGSYCRDGHGIMITENGGCIYGGTSNDRGLGMKEVEDTPAVWYGGTAAAAGLPTIFGYAETSKYSNGAGLASMALSMAVDLGLDALATIGDSLNKLVDQFTVMADTAMKAMSGIGLVIIASLIAIDFATFFILNGFETNLSIMLGKLMKYTFLLFVFTNWSSIVNVIFLDFAQSTATAFVSGNASYVGDGNVSTFLTQPQFLLAKGVEAIAPALNFITSASDVANWENLPLFIFLIGLSFVTLFMLMFSAMYLAFIFIEFYIMAAFNAIFMIFPTLRFTKFIAEGGIGGLVQSTIKLFTAACLIYLIANIANGATYIIEFPGSVKGLFDDTLAKYLFLCLHVNLLVLMVILIPHRIAKIYAGHVRFPG